MSGVRATDEATFNGLQILHGEGTTWVNRTLSRDFARREICGRVNSLSPFVIGQGVAPPTSAAVSLSGRVTKANGRGLSGATVTLTDSRGRIVIARTIAFGRYLFESIPAGDVYTVAVSSKQHRFAVSARTVNVQEAINDVDFVADASYR